MKNRQLFKYAAMLCIGAAALSSCSKKQDAQQQQQQVPELAVITVGPDSATLYTSYPATLHGRNDVEIRPQITGFLTHVHVQEGQHVAAGQVLFTIDQVSLQAAVDAAKSQIMQAEASVKVAEANVNTAQTNATNNKLLLDQNIIAKSAYQTSVDQLNAMRAQLNQARAAVSAARAQLVSAQKNLSYSVVRAPESGIIGTIDFKEGALVSPQTLLTVLSSSNAIEAYFSFTERELLSFAGSDGAGSVESALKHMPAVKLQLADGNIYPLDGKVISISGVLDTSTGSATAKAAFPNPDGLLRSGSTGKVMIPSRMNNVIMIPQSATYEIQGLKYCFTVDGAGKLVQTPITVSPKDDGKNYIVETGLEPGQTVLIEGVGISAQEGMTIKPKTGGAQPAQ
ncbi:MAG: efflux RND transporter periplasmic adaptor subunit [Muribaculaceae bacterium]|nr:efflux RND transporter periplasmic adaptor subunit [Muribaculaceae bacterium]